MKKQIGTGTPVEFDSDEGQQAGTVIGLTRDIGNAQRYAVVELKHSLPGCIWHVPVNELRVKAAA